jgi:hypothetical protein
MAAELSEIFASKFDLLYEPLLKGEVKATKVRKQNCNSACQQSIKYADYVLGWFYKAEDKFDYVPVVLNLELQSASHWTKFFTATP